MKRIYPDLIKFAKITVYDVAPKVLSMFDERLSQYAMDHFKREGIEIKTNHHVEELRAGAPGALNNQKDNHDTMSCYTITLKEQGEVGIGMCVWSTGLMMNPFVSNALAGKVKRQSKSGGIMINERLQVQREVDSVIPDVYALGDVAVMEGATYPATAQVASQEAVWLAKSFNKGNIEHHAFTYRNMGVMAYIGNWNVRMPRITLLSLDWTQLLTFSTIWYRPYYRAQEPASLDVLHGSSGVVLIWRNQLAGGIEY